MPVVRVARGLVGLLDVVAQIVVLDDLLHVRVVLRRLHRTGGAARGSRGLLLLRCH